VISAARDELTWWRPYCWRDLPALIAGKAFNLAE
jgi:hypothetical protein